MSKVRYLHSKHLPPRMNILWLPVVYMMVGYFGLPIWVFSVYATVWAIFFILEMYLIYISEKIEL
mgnify:FL=1